ncbi:hypothetical protein CR513_03905, partial [Mucuna pruriens]
MVQPENFVSDDSKNSFMVSNRLLANGILNFIKSLPHRNFDNVSTTLSIGFEANVLDECVHHKFSESKYILLVLYVDDILLSSSDIGLLHKTKRFLTKNFEMKDLGNFFCIEYSDTKRSLSRLSQENYIRKFLDIFDTKDSKLGDTLIAKGDKFSFKQCPNNNLERIEIEESNIRSSLYSSRHCFCGRIFAQMVNVIERPLKIYYDNNLIVLYSNNNRSFAKSKFINI